MSVNALSLTFEPVDGLQTSQDGCRPGQIPRNGVIDRLLDRFASGRIERIAARYHHSSADQIERHEQAAKCEIFGQHRRDLPVGAVIFVRSIRAEITASSCDALSLQSSPNNEAAGTWPSKSLFASFTVSSAAFTSS